MKDIRELQRLASPAPKPQSLAWDGATLWMGSIETKRVYALDPKAWTVGWETAAPGKPWGMTVVADGELRVICGETAEDNRIIRSCIPRQGFDPAYALPCPEDTGSQLGWDGQRLYLSQWYNQRVLALSADGRVERTIQISHGICGQVIVDGVFYLATTDDEKTNDYWLTRVETKGAELKVEDIARIPFPARALAFDGRDFWTNHRALNQIVRFALG